MYGFIEGVFIAATVFFSSCVSNVNSLECVSMKNRECKTRPKIIDVNSNEPVSYPYSIKVNECSGRCNNINNPYAKLCVPDIIKNINVKVFNLMSRINETKRIIWHETCKCICRLSASVCNNRKRWNQDKRRCECKELIANGICDKGFIWNSSNYICECHKSCGIGEYLNYKKRMCRNSIVDKLVEECTKIVGYNETLNEIPSNDLLSDCISCAQYIVLFVVFLVTSVIVGGGVFVCFYFCRTKKERNVSRVKINPRTKATIC